MAEIASLATPFAAPGGRVIASPFQFATDDNTYLRIVSANSATGVSLAINGRRVDGNGELQPISERHTPNTDRSTKAEYFKLGKGALLNLTIFAASGSPLIGQTYVLAQITQGFGATALLLGTLLGGVVTSTQALGFPGSPIEASTQVEPVVRNIIGTTPAPGVNIAETCPSNARWELVSILFQFITSAIAGTRNLAVTFISGGVGFSALELGRDIAPSTSIDFEYATGIAAFGALAPFNIEYMTLPTRCFMRAGDTFNTFVGGLTVSDQFGAPAYQVREWLEVL